MENHTQIQTKLFAEMIADGFFADGKKRTIVLNPNTGDVDIITHQSGDFAWPEQYVALYTLSGDRSDSADYYQQVASATIAQYPVISDAERAELRAIFDRNHRVMLAARCV